MGKMARFDLNHRLYLEYPGKNIDVTGEDCKVAVDETVLGWDIFSNGQSDTRTWTCGIFYKPLQ
jgi:hypothetical protein